MTAVAVATALWPGMRRILVTIGRWLIQRIKAVGVDRIYWYMSERVEVFKQRRERARRTRRKRWLKGRIMRWQSAMRWLLKHKRKLSLFVARRLDALALENRIPVRSPFERFAK